MTTQRRQESLPPPADINWGGIHFKAYLVPLSLSAGLLPRLSTSAETARDGRQGVLPWYLDDCSPGFLRPGEAGSAFGNWGRDKGRIYFNEGIRTLPPGITCLPNVLTFQDNIITTFDTTGYRAANRRVHGVMYNRRFYAFVGPNMVKDTSTSNPALAVPSSADNITDDVLAVWDGMFNSTRYLVIATDDQTDDAKGTTDPTAASVTWVSLITYGNSGDAIWWGDYFPDLNGGWNIYGGTLNGTHGVWANKGSASIPVTSPVPVVDSGTATVTNASAPTETLTITDITTTMLFENTSPGDGETWSTIANAIGSDDSDATNTFTAGNVTNFLCLDLTELQLTRADLPDGALITDVQMNIECDEGNAADNAIFYSMAYWDDPSASAAPDLQTVAGTDGLGIYTSDPGELSTTDTTETISFATKAARLTASSLRTGTLGFNFTDNSGSTPGVTVDDISSIVISFTRPGVQVVPAGTGGAGMGKLVSNSTWMPVLEPEAADATGITQRRRLRIHKFSFDSTYDRILDTPDTPYTGLPYVGVLCEYLGGIAVAGGRNETLWDQVKLVDSSGQTRSLGFPGIHGTMAQTIVKMRAQGEALLVTVADSDGGDSQLWVYLDGAWNVQGVLVSKSATIAAEPLLWAEHTLGDYQGYDYNFIDQSGDLACVYQFVPADILADPHLTNTSIVKQDGPLYLQLIEQDIGGAVEAQKALMSIEAWSRRIDDDTSYGDVRVLVDTGGDVAISSAEVDNTFQSFGEVYNIQSSGDPGIAIRTGIVRLIHDHATGTAKSPQALPLVFNTVGGWVDQEQVRLYLPVGDALKPTQRSESILSLYKRIKALKATKRPQRFRGAGFDEPAIVQDFRIRYRPSADTTPPTEADIIEAYVDMLIPGVGATS